jgi:diacylglycerol kinase family enzyme
LTQKAGDSFEIPLEMNLKEYSAVISCGGDGTAHEVINGMLAREDGLRVPLGIIPNGSGNALSSGLGMRDTQMALEAIVGGSVSKIDIWKCLLDTEDETSIPRGKAGH